jgi:hypothetical protein
MVVAKTDCDLRILEQAAPINEGEGLLAQQRWGRAEELGDPGRP